MFHRCHRARLLFPTLTLLSFGCGDSSSGDDGGAAIRGDDGGAEDGGASVPVRQGVQIGQGVDSVDLLLALENSGRTAQEQARLGALLPRLVSVLSSGNRAYPSAPAAGDTFTPVRSLHVGVVTGDLGRPPGVQSVAFSTCSEDNGVSHGGGGLLQFSGAIAATDQLDVSQPSSPKVADAVPACAQVSIVPPYVAFGKDGTGPVGATDPSAPDFRNPNNPLFQLSCIATVGTGGCGLEQPLESLWKALAPSTVTSFYGPDSAGKGDTANASFARSDSVLAVLQLGAEDDCSVTSQGSFMFEQGDVQGYAPGVRCQMMKDQPQFAAAIQPVQRYAEGLVGLRAAFPERLVYAALVGLPQGTGVPYADPDALLAMPPMQTSLASTTALTPVCGSEATGDAAYPGRRAVQLAKAIKSLGGDFVLRSVCDADYGPALDQLIEKVAAQLKGACLPRALEKDGASGRVPCDVLEVLAKDLDRNDVGSCSAPGRSPAGTREVDGRSRTACKVDQLAVKSDSVPQGDGWYYDDFSEELRSIPGCTGQRVVFTSAAELQAGANALLECE